MIDEASYGSRWKSRRHHEGWPSKICRALNSSMKIPRDFCVLSKIPTENLAACVLLIFEVSLSIFFFDDYRICLFSIFFFLRFSFSLRTNQPGGWPDSLVPQGGAGDAPRASHPTGLLSLRIVSVYIGPTGLAPSSRRRGHGSASWHGSKDSPLWDDIRCESVVHIWAMIACS